MLMGSLPTVANAKDDAFVLYSEDGEHMRKMKREYFTADIERVGCDYWKEGSGNELKNPGGTKAEDTGHNYDKFTIYSSDKAKNYRHGGHFWACFKLRDWTQEKATDLFMCGERGVGANTFFRQSNSFPFRSVSTSGNWPVFFPKSVDFYYTTEGGIERRFTGTPFSYLEGWDPIHTGYDSSLFLSGIGLSYNKDMDFGFHGKSVGGNYQPCSFTYAGNLHDNLKMYYGPIVPTFSVPYSTWLDPESYVRQYWPMYFDTENRLDEPDWNTWGSSCSFSEFTGAANIYALCVDNTLIETPSFAEPTFCHVLHILSSGENPRWQLKQNFIKPKGVLCSIPVFGVESYDGPIYCTQHQQILEWNQLEGQGADFGWGWWPSPREYGTYHGGYQNYIYASVEPETSAAFYFKSKGMYEYMTNQDGVPLVGNNSFYYVNDFENDYTHKNFFAISRKGIEIQTKSYKEDVTVRYTNPPVESVRVVEEGVEHVYTIPEGGYLDIPQKYSIERSISIGCENLLNVDDVDGLRYPVNNFLRMDYNATTGSGEVQDAWDVDKYGDDIWEYNSVPLEDDFYILSRSGGEYVALKDTYTIPFTYDGDTIKVEHMPAPSSTTAPYDIISLKTLWKMTAKCNHETYKVIDTNYAGQRPSEMTLNLGRDASLNQYGFGDEFVVDTTNNDVYITGYRVNSNISRYAGAKAIRYNSIVMKDNTGAYQSIRLTNNDASSLDNQANTNAKFRPEDLYFCTYTVSSGSVIVNGYNRSPLFKSYKKVKINDICGYDKPYGSTSTQGDLYIRGTIDSNGYFTIMNNRSSNPSNRNGFITSKLPTSNDGYYYIYLGKFKYIDDGYYFNFNEFNPIYFYNNGRIQQYHYGSINKYFNGLLASQTAFDPNAVNVKDENGVVRLEFDPLFDNSYDRSTGTYTLNLDTSALTDLKVLPILSSNDEAMLDISPSVLTKVCDLPELKPINDTSLRHIDVTVIFRTTDGSPMTDGLFEARLSYSSASLDTWMDGSRGYPGGYFKKRKSFINGESEVTIKMSGTMSEWFKQGSTPYPYLVVRHTCSTNIDVGYVINQFQLQ